MKKILLGSAAAMIAAFGFSSFKTAKFTSYYWFNLKSGVSKPIGSALTNGDVSFNKTFSTAPNPGISCNPSGSDQCIVGFNATQVTNINHTRLLTTAMTPQQQPQVTNSVRL